MILWRVICESKGFSSGKLQLLCVRFARPASSRPGKRLRYGRNSKNPPVIYRNLILPALLDGSLKERTGWAYPIIPVQLPSPSPPLRSDSSITGQILIQYFSRTETVLCVKIESNPAILSGSSAVPSVIRIAVLRHVKSSPIEL